VKIKLYYGVIIAYSWSLGSQVCKTFKAARRGRYRFSSLPELKSLFLTISDVCLTRVCRAGTVIP